MMMLWGEERGGGGQYRRDINPFHPVGLYEKTSGDKI